MISLQTSTPLSAPAPSPAQTALRTLREHAEKPRETFGLPSVTQMREAREAQQKEMAARKLDAVRERMKVLKLMVKIDPKAALHLSTDLAKELKSAVKAYVDAGGKNVSQGEMAMIRDQAGDARDAADVAADAVPADAAADLDTEMLGAEAPDAEAPDAEALRGRLAYAAAEGLDGVADRLEAVQAAATADQGFFEQVRLALGELKEAREKIKAAWSHPSQPDEEDWKAADAAMAALEREIDMAPTGAPAAPAGVSVTA